MTETLSYTWEKGQLAVKTVCESSDVTILRKLVSSMPEREVFLTHDA
jgi:hypothetical protein